MDQPDLFDLRDLISSDSFTHDERMALAQFQQQANLMLGLEWMFSRPKPWDDLPPDEKKRVYEIASRPFGEEVKDHGNETDPQSETRPRTQG